ncbi:hypothetical protein V8C86DRAFT_2843259 [Haematococcus lacustris]
MPPKQTGSDKKAGTKHSRSLSDSDTGSTPAFKSRELPKSRRLVAPATCTSPGASGSVATVLSTDREVVDEWSAPEVPITTHDVTVSVVTVLIAHYVMLLAKRKTDGVTGCKYARWQDATDAIVGAVLMGLLETLGYVSKDLKYDDIVLKIHKCGHNTVSKKTRSPNEAAPSSVKKENEDKYSQWDAVWGKFFTAQRRPSSWEKLIALALKFKEGILPDPQYFTVKSLFVTDAMAKHIDEGFQQLVADKDITVKVCLCVAHTIDADLLANRVRYGGASQFSDTASEPCITAQSAHDYEELQRQQAAAAAAEEARIAAEAAAAAAEAAAAAAEAAATLVPETPEAKRAKIAAEMAKAKVAYEAQMKALQEEEDMVAGDGATGP